MLESVYYLSPAPLLYLEICLPDELSRMITCKWSSDLDEVVLEIQEKDKRATTDAAICTWRDLLQEMEETGTVDFTVNSHELKKPSAVKSSDGYLAQHVNHQANDHRNTSWTEHSNINFILITTHSCSEMNLT